MMVNKLKINIMRKNNGFKYKVVSINKYPLRNATCIAVVASC